MPSENLKIVSCPMPITMIARLDAMRAHLQAADPSRAVSRSEVIRQAIEAMIKKQETKAA